MNDKKTMRDKIKTQIVFKKANMTKYKQAVTLADQNASLKHDLEI
jgi:hypothetical protein